MQSCSKREGGLEPENMGETGLFLNSLLELRINTSHHRLPCWLMVKCAAKLSHWPQLLARHCHVSCSWRVVRHLAPRHRVFFPYPETQSLFWLPGILSHCSKTQQGVGGRQGKLQSFSECLCGKWTNS